MQPSRAWTSGLGVLPLLLARCGRCVTQVRPSHRVWFFVTCPSAALGAHVFALSSAPWHFFTGVHAHRVFVCGVCGYLALVDRCAHLVCLVCADHVHLALVHRYARLVCVVCGVQVAFLHRCARPVFRMCGVLGHLALVHRCLRLVRCVCDVFEHLALVRAWCVPCAVSEAIWRLFTDVRARFFCVCGVLDPLALVHRSVRAACYCVRSHWQLGGSSTSVRAWYVVCAVFLATWRLFTSVGV